MPILTGTNPSSIPAICTCRRPHERRGHQPRENMKLLVTGTDGYIGVLLADVLTKRGHHVTGLDSGFYRDGLLYDGVLPPARQIKQDIRDITQADLRGYD